MWYRVWGSALLAAGLVGSASPPAPAGIASALQGEPNAHFIASKRRGKAPLTVGFQNLSAGTITQWQWFFGDGSVSTDEHPVHIFRRPGTYTVALLVIGPGGNDIETRQNYVVAKAAINRGRLPRVSGGRVGETGQAGEDNNGGNGNDDGPRGGVAVPIANPKTILEDDDDDDASKIDGIFEVDSRPFQRLSRHHTLFGPSQYFAANVAFDAVPIRLMNPLGITMVAAVLFYDRGRDDMDELDHMPGRFLGAVVVELPPHGSRGISCDTLDGEGAVSPVFPQGAQLAQQLYAEVISVPLCEVPIEDDGEDHDLAIDDDPWGGGGIFGISDDGDDDDDDDDDDDGDDDDGDDGGGDGDDDDDDDMGRIADGLGILVETGSLVGSEFQHEPFPLNPKIFSLPQNNDMVPNQKDVAIQAVLDGLDQENDLLSPNLLPADLFEEFGIPQGDDDDDA